MTDWYWSGLLVAGVAQAIDGLFLYRSRGRLNTGSVITGLIEFCWLFVSIFALATGRVGGPQATAAIAYISYNLAGVVQSLVLLRRHGDLDTFAAPRWMVVFSISVGCLFAVVSVVSMAGGAGALP